MEKKFKKKMVICGASGINNSGDEAILDVMVNQFQNEFDITVISLSPKVSKKYHKNIRFIKLGNKKQCIRFIKKSDIFLLGGGGLFQDETSLFNVLRWYQILNLAHKYCKKVIIYANSVGPLNYKFSRMLCKKIFNKVNLIILRDTISYNLIKNLGVSTPIKVTADPVFSYDVSSINKNHVEWKLPDKYVAIAIRHWYDSVFFLPAKISNKLHIHMKKRDIYIKKLNKIINYINHELGLPVVFLSFMPERDEVIAEQILDTQELKSMNYIIDGMNQTIFPIDMLHIINNSEFVIGMRLHSIIYAVDVQKPFIAIDYSKKVNGLLNDINMITYSIPVDKLSLELFCNKYQLLMKNKKKISYQLQKVSYSMKKLECKNKIYIKNILER